MGALRANLRQLVADRDFGAIPLLLLSLTVVTGLVDAVSILELGRVFVANMTGNIVFIGFAVAGAPGFSLAASVTALGGFLVGAGLGGPLTRRLGSGRARLLGFAAGMEFVLVAVALLIAAMVAVPFPGGYRDAIAGLLAVSMGLQNSVARKLAVPDLTTTVLTMALTGVAADLHLGAGQAITRRLLSVVAMFGGALVGALLVIHGHVAVALGIAVALLAVVSSAALRAASRVVPRPAEVALEP